MSPELGSGKHEDLSNGLQQSSIYWETGHRTYLPFWSSFVQKFTPKLIDDYLRNLFNLTKPVQREPFVFYKEGYFRSYYGDPDVSHTFSINKRANFTFNPCCVRSPSSMEENMNKWVEKNELAQLLLEAYKKDLPPMEPTYTPTCTYPSPIPTKVRKSILLI